MLLNKQFSLLYLNFLCLKIWQPDTNSLEANGNMVSEENSKYIPSIVIVNCVLYLLDLNRFVLKFTLVNNANTH